MGLCIRFAFRPDATSGFQAVHLGHLHVHQHHVVARFPHCRQRRPPIRHCLDLVLLHGQQPGRHPTAHGVVLGEQNPQRGRRCVRVGRRLREGRRSENCRHRFVEARLLHRLVDLCVGKACEVAALLH